jgi:hypothetical protein
MIRIKRKHALIDLFRSYKILLDDKEVGRIKNGKVFEVHVSPGTHRLQLKIDWCASNPVEFECNDELIEFECGNNFVGRKVFLGVLNTLGARGDYLWLTQL